MFKGQGKPQESSFFSGQVKKNCGFLYSSKDLCQTETGIGLFILGARRKKQRKQINKSIKCIIIHNWDVEKM